MAWLRHPSTGRTGGGAGLPQPSGWTATRRHPDVLIRAVVRLARSEPAASLQNFLRGASSTARWWWSGR